jgi:hypothetical protein
VTAYKILLADAILAAGASDPGSRLVFPGGCALVRQLEPGSAGTHWHEFIDPEAPAELEGREVDLRLGRDDGKPVIRSRRAIEVHRAPGEGDPGLPCCGIHPADLPRGDRVSPDPELATCGGAAWAA